MDNRIAESFFLRDDHRLCGLRLRPLTLRRWIRLEALLPGMLEGHRHIDLLQLWVAAQILSDSSRLRPLPWHSIFWAPQKHTLAWIAYTDDMQSPPRYWQRDRPTLQRKMPWQLATAAYVAKGIATPVEQVLDMPVSQVWQWQATLAEESTPPDRTSPLISEADEAEMAAQAEAEELTPPPEVIAAWEAWREVHAPAQQETAPL